ncbi:hypothetical protein G9444_6419 [Rhodococcus erythropolis]|uniref:4Fe-4S Wbl-type domain-containing protein n=1 Tax=Rhodococcus erythropolis TaxID=1833 RepID=A0A6G9D3J4_RHOER|nr:hypothetical protein [Rhodococcus erythropolis]QIP43662.1 hypothetical protein G9444_6419 [Rhodococcus erythropolis]
MAEQGSVSEATPRRRSGSRKEPGTLSLLAEILENRPNLPEAKCRTHWDLFDDIAAGKATNDDKHFARGLCSRCPHLTECPDALTTPRRKVMVDELSAVNSESAEEGAEIPHLVMNAKTLG